MRDQASFRDEYAALTGSGGFVDLPDLSIVGVTGEDRSRFLHKFCTNVVDGLLPGEHCEAFFTDVKGKIVGQALISCRAQQLMLISPPGQALRLIDHVGRYIIREDVQLHDLTARRGCSLLVGARDWSDVRTAIDQSDVVASIALGRSSEVRGLLVDYPSEHAATLAAKFEGLGLQRSGLAAATALRVEAGIPLYATDFDDTNFPQELCRDAQAISFTKGCYLGQETVARIDALGHVNQRLVGVKFAADAAPRVGLELTAAGKLAGRLTTVSYAPRLQAMLGLAVVRRAQATAGSVLDSSQGPGEVVSLPV